MSCTKRTKFTFLAITMFLLHSTSAMAQGTFADDTEFLTDAFNEVAETIDRTIPFTDQQYTQIMQKSCDTIRTVIRRNVIVRQNALIQALRAKEGDAVDDVMQDEERFEQFLTAEKDVLLKQGVSPRATALAIQLLRESRLHVIEGTPTHELEVEDLEIVEERTCSEADSATAEDESLHRKAWGAVKILGGLTIVAGDATAWITSLGLGAPLAAASGSLGGIIAADGYSDLTN